MRRDSVENLTASYVTPINNRDAELLALMLQKYGATNACRDGHKMSASWAHTVDQQAFEQAYPTRKYHL